MKQKTYCRQAQYERNLVTNNIKHTHTEIRFPQLSRLPSAGTCLFFSLWSRAICSYRCFSWGGKSYNMYV